MSRLNTAADQSLTIAAQVKMPDWCAEGSHRRERHYTQRTPMEVAALFIY